LSEQKGNQATSQVDECSVEQQSLDKTPLQSTDNVLHSAPALLLLLLLHGKGQAFKFAAGHVQTPTQLSLGPDSCSRAPRQHCSQPRLLQRFLQTHCLAAGIILTRPFLLLQPLLLGDTGGSLTYAGCQLQLPMGC
jgi:hypothetical protein